MAKQQVILKPKYPYGKSLTSILNEIRRHYAELPPTEQPPVVEFEFNGLIISVRNKN
jgi:hypothetical protein